MAEQQGHARRSSVRASKPLTELTMEEADQSREVKVRGTLCFCSRHFPSVSQKAFRNHVLAAQALLSWANNLLHKRDMSAPSLGSFSDGLTLVHLVEVAFNGKLASFNSTPRTVFHKLGNITATLEFLKTQGVSFVSVDSDMIVQAKVKPLTIVLWSILRQLTLAGLKAIGQKGGAGASGGGGAGAGGAAGGNSIKGSLLSWCNGIVSATRAEPVQDFSESFKDGSIFCSIISKLVPDANMSGVASGGGDAAEALALAFKVAEERLGVPALLTAEDFTDPDSAPDEQSVIDYMCLLLSASQRLKEAEAAAAALAAAASNSKEMEAELKQQQAELAAAQVPLSVESMNWTR